MEKLLKPKQIAQALGVSEASIKRWCDQGRFETVRTAGGHRRLSVRSVLRYLRDAGQPLVRPDVLGLPSVLPAGERDTARAAPAIREALEAGDEERVRALVFNLFLAGRSCVEICDRGLAPSFEEIGQGWEHGSVEVYQERRAVEICSRLVHELLHVLPPVSPGAPRTIGGTLAGDPYTLATSMAELTLREAGWNATSLGNDLPPETICAAMHKEAPRFLWLSVSTSEPRTTFLAGWEKVRENAEFLGIPVAVGGRGVDDELRRTLSYAACCTELAHLLGFARSVYPDATATSSS